MPWFKVDDKLHDHRKSRAAGRSAMGVWVLAGSWSADNLTNGFIPATLLSRWGGKTDAARLVKAGLWHVDEQDGEKGWRFHNWAEHQPTKEEVEAKREAARERMRAVRANKDGTSRSVRPTPSRPVPTRPSTAAAAEGNAAAAPVDNHPVGSSDLPPAVEILKAGLEAHKLVVRWDRLDTDQLAQIDALIATHGDGPLIRAAIATHRPNAPAAFAQAWLGAWSSLPAPGTKLRVVADEACTAPGHVGTVRHCAQCAGEQKAAR